MIAAVLVLALVAARPLTLAEATELALGADVGVDRAEVEEARARLQTTRANLERVRVSVDASLQELYAGASNAFFVTPAPPLGWAHGLLGLSNVQASVQAPLYSGGRVEADIAGAEHLQRAAGFEIEAARRAVVVAVARAYWSERRLALLAAAQGASDERLKESERIVLARVKAGLVAGLDQNRAASRRAELEVQKTSLQSQRREAAVRLATVLGIAEPVELTDPLPPDEAVPAADALVQQALDARAELKAAEARGLAVDEEKRSAEAGFLPQLDARALVQVGNNLAIAGAGTRSVSGGANPVEALAGNLQAGLTLSVNLFDTWQTTHAVQDAAHRRRLADAELRAQRLTVENDVRLAHAQVINLHAQRQALTTTEAIERDNVQILQHAYERGEVLVTELLDEQERLGDVERQIVDVNAQLALARLELAAAVGAAPIPDPEQKPVKERP